MNNKATYPAGGVSLFGILFIVFLVLKLTGHIDWSWWWITAPVWVPVVVCATLLLSAAIAYVAAILYFNIRKRRRR